jgi:hypothetical protein
VSDAIKKAFLEVAGIVHMEIELAWLLAVGSISKGCNAALVRWGGSLRARQEAAICVVARA